MQNIPPHVANPPNPKAGLLSTRLPQGKPDLAAEEHNQDDVETGHIRQQRRGDLKYNLYDKLASRDAIDWDEDEAMYEGPQGAKGEAFEGRVAFVPDLDEGDKGKEREESNSVHKKPPLSYASMIVEALEAHDNNLMTLADIYASIASKYPFFKTAAPGWKNSIRHNLSLHPFFARVARPPSMPGKGSFWKLATGSPDEVPKRVAHVSHSLPRDLSTINPHTPLLHSHLHSQEDTFGEDESTLFGYNNGTYYNPSYGGPLYGHYDRRASFNGFEGFYTGQGVLGTATMPIEAPGGGGLAAGYAGPTRYSMSLPHGSLYAASYNNYYPYAPYAPYVPYLPNQYGVSLQTYPVPYVGHPSYVAQGPQVAYPGAHAYQPIQPMDRSVTSDIYELGREHSYAKDLPLGESILSSPHTPPLHVPTPELMQDT